jgi:hypothetical protein
MGALVLSNPVLEVLRRELRRVSPDVRIDVEQIKSVLTNEVLKRAVVESEKAEEARRKIARTAGKLLRTKVAPPATDPTGLRLKMESEANPVSPDGEN